MNSSIIEALQIMIRGIVIVVFFLIILVYDMKLVAAIVAQVDKLMAPPKKEAAPLPSAVRASGNHQMTSIAIALAHIHIAKK